MKPIRLLRRLAGLTAALACCVSLSAHAAANFQIIVGDSPGEGFNDTTPVAPVGGNPGTTLGQQRLNAFQYAASLWGATLDSAVTITIVANFDPLTCNANSAVLGSAGPLQIFANHAPNVVPDTWYHAALAVKQAGTDLDPSTPMMRARFNTNLGQLNCLAGSPFYLGLDNNAGTAVDLVEVLLHEFGHGLGFSTVTSNATGNYLAGLPSIFDHFLFDNTQGKTWVQMTAAERQASAINPRQLVWTGANVTNAAPSVLQRGTPQVDVLAPATIAGQLLVGAASFGPPLEAPGLTKQVMPVVENGGLGLACNPLDAENAAAVKNRIALVLRGTCTFVVKVKNAQNAGAVGVLVMDNTTAMPPAGLGGADPTITIPSGRIGFNDGVKLISAMNFTPGSRSTGVVARIGTNRSQLAGADNAGRVLMFTPNPLVPGSSVSHFDDSAIRNLLMEPAINRDLTQSVIPPFDLTFPLFRDIGW